MMFVWTVLLIVGVVLTLRFGLGTSSHDHAAGSRVNVAVPQEETRQRTMGLTQCAQELEKSEGVNSCFVDMPLVDAESKVFLWDVTRGKRIEKEATHDVMRSDLTGFSCTKSAKSSHEQSHLLILTYPDGTVVTLNPDSCIIRGVYHVARPEKHVREGFSKIHPDVQRLVADAKPLSTADMQAESDTAGSNDVMTWAHVPGPPSVKFKDVAISSKGTLYAISTTNRAYVKKRWNAGAWQEMGGTLTEISVENGGATVAAVNGQGGIFYRVGVNPTTNQKGTHWLEAARPPSASGVLKDVSLSSHYIWGVTTSNLIYYAPIGTGNWQSVGGNLVQISAHGLNVVGAGIPPLRGIFKHNGLNIGWHAYPGSALYASMGKDGEFWVLAHGGVTLKYNGAVSPYWFVYPGTVRQIDVADANNIAGVNIHGSLFVRIPAQSVAARFAPVLSFPTNTLGYPMDAGIYFNSLFIQKNPGVRYNGCTFSHITQNAHFDLTKMVTYYKYGKCHGRIAIDYWWFYGFQYPCFHVNWCQAKGWHGGDWEHTTIILNAAGTAVEEVRFYQHTGHYPRVASNTQFYAGRVKIYVGSSAHGSYDTNVPPPFGNLLKCLYYGDLEPGRSAHLWSTTGSKLLNLQTSPEWWINQQKYQALCQREEKLRGLKYFCGVFGQMDPNLNQNLCPLPHCKDDGCNRNGKTCKTDFDCTSFNVLGVVKQIAIGGAPVGCCQGSCVRKKQDWAKQWYCPHQCVGKIFGKPGTC